MIGRIQSRSAFTRVRAEGVHLRSGVLSCTMVLDPSLSGALVGYALSRSYGNAVHRNRLRRQLRVLVNAHEAQFRPGIYVFGASPRAKDTAFGTLDSHLSSLLGKLAGVAA